MKKLFIWLGLSVLMLIFWIIGLTAGNTLFPNQMPQPDVSPAYLLVMLWIAGALNTFVILYFIYNSRGRGWKLVGAVFLVVFGIQYFMSQIETLWFNDSLNLPLNGIWAFTSGGAMMILLFSLTATWFTGKFKPSNVSNNNLNIRKIVPSLKVIMLLSVVGYPLIYFLAGYFIAWQFDEVRMLYTGTTRMQPIVAIMQGNFTSGLYYFQILRAILCILIAMLALSIIEGSRIHKGVTLGLLFAFLGSSQLLIPNPYMSEMVRWAHLLETSSSNFIWGFLIVWVLIKPLPTEDRLLIFKIV